MLEFLTEPANKDDAINMLKDDHNKVKDLFDRFQKSDDRKEKIAIANEAIDALKVHAELEEKIFYRTVRPELDDDIMNEADEEHHVAKVLIAELSQMTGKEDHYDAKFHVLSESIRHHIKEEEGKMMPKARGTDIDFIALGQRMLEQREELEENGVPECDEERMVKGVGADNDDSPVKNARGGAKARKPAQKAKKAVKAKAKAQPKKRAQASAARRPAAKAKSRNGGKSSSSYSSGTRKKAVKASKTRRTGTR